MSHVSAIPSLASRVTLLNTLAGVHDTSVLRGTLPLLTPVLEDSDESRWLASLPQQDRDHYLGLLFNAFTGQSASLLADKESELGKFVQFLLSEGAQTPLASQLRELLLERFAASVFGSLESEQKVSYFGLIVKCLHSLDDTAQVTMVKAVMKRFELDVTSLILVIDDLARPLSDTVAHPKKQKQDAT
jgi:U3 small nucleolar RNA-associated protein 10